MPGPLPKPASQRRRRNVPTVPTTTLPAAGRVGPAPKPPLVPKFEKPAKAWWSWAWHTPQAAAWSAGDLYALARRAHLEDVVDALDSIEGFDLADFLDVSDDVRAVNQRLRTLLALVRGQAGNRTTVLREMRDLDDRFGLTPKGLAALRWSIVDADKVEVAKPKKGLASVTSIKAVDPRVAAAR